MKKYIQLIAVITIFTIGSVSAQNISDGLRLAIGGLGSNARALGMGNSYVGLSDDASAAFYNPAGFGLIKRLEFSGGLEYNSFKNETTFLRNTSNYSNSSTRLNRVSFAFPFPTFRGSLVFGLSYHSTKDLTGALKFNGFNNSNTSMIQNLLGTGIPFDLYLTDDNGNTIINGNLNQSGTILSSGSIDNWTFSGAVEVYKNLFIGGNLNFISGSYESNNDYYEDDTEDKYKEVTAPGYPETVDFQTFYLNRILKWDLSGWDFKFGLLYQFQKYARLGLTIQFPKTFTITEDFLVDGSSDFGTGTTYRLDTDFYSDQVEYDIVTPFAFTGGFSFNVVGLIFSAQAEFTDYSQMEFQNGDGLSEQYVEGLNKDIKSNLRSTINYNFGLEYTVPQIGLRIRGGYLVKPSAYQDDPSEFDKKYVTAGFGFLTNETIGIDVAYAHGWWQTFGDNYGVNVSRTNQDITFDKIMLTATYRF